MRRQKLAIRPLEDDSMIGWMISSGASRTCALGAEVRRRWYGVACTAFLLSTLIPWRAHPGISAEVQVGARGLIGCRENPTLADRLEISRPGVYENYLVDSHWAGGNRVKITADDVILRNCEIRNATGNGVGVFGTNVTIENCKIHHFLASTFRQQADAHGITGRWDHVTIRNCEIFYVSGDCIQLDPDRSSTGRVLI
jgi:hypothetical protein